MSCIKTPINYKCDFCGKPIAVKNWQFNSKYARKHHYCSVDCKRYGYGEHSKGENNPFYGKHHTKETKQIISDKNKGKVPWSKGKKMSKEHRKKLSQLRIKYIKEHPEYLKKIIKSLTGRKQSPETIEKRVSKLKGKKRSRRIVEKMRKKMRRGKNHKWWKGGVSDLRKRLRNCGRMKLWREAVFARDNWTCQECGIRGGKLHAHHKIEFWKLLDRLKKMYGIKNLYERAVRSRILWDIKNGLTLCKKCHEKTKSFGFNGYNKH